MTHLTDLAGYTIKPLDWKFSEVHYHVDEHTSKTSAEFWDSGNYTIMRMVDERIPKIFGRVDISGLGGGKLTVAGSVDIAKQMCEDHHRNQVMKLLMVKQ